MRLAVAGIVLGLFVSPFVGTVLRTFLFGIDAYDPLTLLGIAGLLLLAVLAACTIPARRAASMDPIIALRS
ncbi:MAG TPA: hypothetical protein VMZ90_01765 [Vicinamibacterales bacterium]|nr:hypothetical protein [Vicinamibacterales bacterium]